MNSLRPGIKSGPNEEQTKLLQLPGNEPQFIGHPSNCLFTISTGQYQPYQNNYNI